MDTLVKDLGPVTEPTDTLLEISKIIMGDDGGEVKNGAFAVELPAGAIDGTAQVGIRLNPVDALSCELTITPLSANGFAKPVLLTVDCTGILHLERYGILWLNEATGEWVEMGSTVDTKEGTVSAELEHFSHYKVAEVLKEGKAGW